VLNRGDRYEGAPLLFYEGHRVDLELEPGGGVTLFAGAGRRIFRRTSRSRWEVDGGAGGSVAPVEWLHLLLALSLRYHEADGDEYNQYGGTVLAVGRVRLPAGLYVRLGLTTGADRYSIGRDVLVKPSLGLWGPSFSGVRLGASYEYAWRDSTAEVSFSYTEHRALLKMRWTFDLNPWAPRVVEPEDHVPLPYGVGGEGEAGLDEERIQDLLRQDEAARRGSSCVN